MKLFDKTSKIDVLWDRAILHSYFTKDHMAKDNEEAVRKFAEAAEAKWLGIRPAIPPRVE
jgi:hypothetical protein